MFVSAFLSGCAIQQSGQSKKCARKSARSQSVKQMAPGFAR